MGGQIAAVQILGVAWKVLKYVINEPIVNKAMDNWVNGTSNKIDDMVWRLIESFADVPEHVAAEEAPKAVASLQAEYNSAAPEDLVAMKLPTRRWMSADVIAARDEWTV